MNLVEAVRELETNPKALAITFTGAHGAIRRMEIDRQHYPEGVLSRLIFPPTQTKRKQPVIASCTDFLLRTDFQIEYEPMTDLKEIKQHVAKILKMLEGLG